MFRHCASLLLASSVLLALPARAGEGGLEQVRALRAAGDLPGARQHLDRLLEGTPRNAAAAVERASVLVALGEDLDLALADAEQGVKALGTEARAFRVLAEVHEEREEAEPALAAYEKALALEENVTVRRRLGALHARQGRPEKAIRHWEAVRSAEPGEAGAYAELAALYEQAGRMASAEAAHRELLARTHPNALLLGRFADFLERQGKLPEARKVREEAQSLAPARSNRNLRPLPPSRR